MALTPSSMAEVIQTHHWCPLQSQIGPHQPILSTSADRPTEWIHPRRAERGFLRLPQAPTPSAQQPSHGSLPINLGHAIYPAPRTVQSLSTHCPFIHFTSQVIIMAFVPIKGLRVQCAGHESGSPDLPGCAPLQIVCRVSRINALLLFRCRDLFLVEKIGHLRTTALVSLAVAGEPDHTEALGKQNPGMLAPDRISRILLPELPMSRRDGTQDSLTSRQGWGFRATSFQGNSSLPC